MRKLLLLCTLLLAALFATSCFNEDPIERETPVVQNGFFMQLDVAGSGSVGTRLSYVPAEEGEQNVYSLFLVFYNAATGAFVDYINASPVTDPNTLTTEPLNMNTPLLVDFTGTALNNNTDYRILVVANIHEYIDNYQNWLDAMATSTFNEAHAAIISGHDTSRPIDREFLLMTSTFLLRAGQAMVHTNLLRALVRFDIDFSAVPANFTLETASVWNVPTTTALFNPDHNDFREHFERFAGTTDFNACPQGVYRAVLHAFENSVTGSYMGDNFTTCLILGIRDQLTGRRTYYRVNVNEDGAQLLRRNFVYQITVTGIRGAGENTELDAYNARVTLLDINVRDWQDGGHGGVMFDGEDILAIGANRIDFEGPGGVEYVTIFTFSPNPDTALNIIETDLPAGITATLEGNQLRVQAGATNVPRGGFIELQFGTMRGVVQVVQSDAVNQFLNLSVGTTELDSFDHYVNHPTGVSQMIYVTSNCLNNGAWTATIHNGGFDFVQPSSGANPTITGVNGDSFSVTTLATISGASHYAFIIVSLDASPSINRVLVLRQEGTGWIRLTDASQATVYWTATGVAELWGGMATVEIPVEASSPWTFMLSGPASSMFTYTRIPTPGALQPHSYTLQITAEGPNAFADMQAAVMTAFLAEDPSTRVNINVRQRPHTLSTSPTSFPPVSAASGGTVMVNVASSYPGWEVENVNLSAPAAGFTTTRVLNTATGLYDRLEVFFPPMGVGITGVSITATITLRIPGTNVRAVVTLQQGERVLRNLAISTARPTVWGTWSPTGGTAVNRNNFGRLRDELASASNFGPTGAVVPSGTRTFLAESASTRGRVPGNNVHIHLANSTNYNATEAAAVRAWLEASPYRVLVITNELNSTGVTTLLGAWGMAGHSQGTGTARGVNVAAAQQNMAIYNYMFVSGPFSTGGTSRSGQVSVRPQDSVGGTLSITNPGLNSMVALVTHPGSPARIDIGICPQRRIVFVGEPELFGRGGRTRTDWNNPANVEFVRNVAAWIINTTQQGEYFTNQFINP